MADYPTYTYKPHAPRTFSPARIDFSQLGNLVTNYQQGQAWRQKKDLRDALSSLPAGPNGEIDFAAATRLLLQHGDVDNAAAFARLGQGNEPPSSYREFQLAQSNPEFGEFLNQDTAKPTEAQRNAEYFSGLPEGDPRRQFAPRSGSTLQAVDKKAIFDSEDSLVNLDGTIDALGEAERLNDGTFEGYTAGARAGIGSKLPDWMVPDGLADPKTAKDTLEWQKVMSPEAIKTMASTLKGATTDFELNTFVELLSDPSTPRDVRKRVIKRMATLAKNKRQLEAARATDIRGGTYYAPGGGVTGGAGVSGGAQPTPEKVNALRAHANNPAAIQAFEKFYGPGSAQRYLAGQ